MIVAAILALTTLAAGGADDPPPPGAAPLDVIGALEKAVGDAIERARPSVVAISRRKSADGQTTAVRGRSATPRGAGAVIIGDIDPLGEDTLSFDYGSGVVVGPAGQILTAYHVVEGAEQLTVRAAGRQSFAAEILAADPRSDLAVIAPIVPAGTPEPNLPPIPLGRAEDLRPGSFLVALGNSYNVARDGEASAGWGILANSARRLDTPIDDQFGRSSPPTKLYHYPMLLQLDTKLNLGMSGGAVINLRGELVGLTTASAEALGFDPRAGYALPINAIGRRIVATLIQGKEVAYGFLGISIDNQVTNRISGVGPGTPAEEAGLLSGDQIVAVNGLAVPDDSTLTLVLTSFEPGATVALKINRQDRPIDKSVRLAKYAVRGPIIATARPPAWRGVRVDYTSVLTGGLMSNDVLNAMAQGAVGIVEVEPGSAADRAGLKRGHIVLAIGDRPVHDPAEFAAAIPDKDGPVVVRTHLGDFTVE